MNPDASGESSLRIQEELREAREEMAKAKAAAEEAKAAKEEVERLRLSMASDEAKALAAANGGASQLPPPLNTLEPGTDIFVSFSSASMSPFALNWVANLRHARGEPLR